MTLTERGKLSLIEIESKEAKIIPLKIVSKTAVKKNKLQINLSNGWNLLTDNRDLKVRDLVLINTEKRQIDRHIPFKEGNTAFITGGTHSGKVATFNGYEEVGILKKKKIAKISVDKDNFKTALDNIFIIGEKSPEVKINE
jgi:small subunit ribosomal protein S4e